MELETTFLHFLGYLSHLRCPSNSFIPYSVQPGNSTHPFPTHYVFSSLQCPCLGSLHHCWFYNRFVHFPLDLLSYSSITQNPLFPLPVVSILIVLYASSSHPSLHSLFPNYLRVDWYLSSHPSSDVHWTSCIQFSFCWYSGPSLKIVVLLSSHQSCTLSIDHTFSNTVSLNLIVRFPSFNLHHFILGIACSGVQHFLASLLLLIICVNLGIRLQSRLHHPVSHLALDPAYVPKTFRFHSLFHPLEEHKHIYDVNHHLM